MAIEPIDASAGRGCPAGASQDLCPICDPWAVDHHGDLFFGHVGAHPSGIFKVEMPAERKKENAHLPIRIWG